MANSTVKLLTNQAEVPLLYCQVTRATLENKDASPRMPYTFYGDRINADFGQPQLIFCEDMLPSEKGMFSVSKVQEIPALSPAVTVFDQALVLRDSDENNNVFVPAAGVNYVLNANTATWSSVNPFAASRFLVTQAFVGGRTFICYEKERIIEYDAGTNTFATISLTFPVGMTITDVRGISGASNYLLLFTDTIIYWCAPLNVLEFADINQGAGNQIPIDLKGKITCVRPIAGGFIIYTVKNAVGARFTNNAAAPFSFKEIANAGGSASGEVSSGDAEGTFHYLWGTAGLQKISLEGAQSIFPAVTDFLTGRKIERWNSTTKEVELTSGVDFAVKLAFITGRYLTISYGAGITTYEFILVYDTILERWGKIRADHVDVFTYPYVTSTATYTYDELIGNYDSQTVDYVSYDQSRLITVQPKKGFAILTAGGQIDIVNFDYAQSEDVGVAIYGHIAQRHDKQITVTDIWIDGMKATPTPVISLLCSDTGNRRADVVTPDLEDDSVEGYGHYSCRHTTTNFDVAIEASVVLSSLLVQVIKHGYR